MAQAPGDKGAAQRNQAGRRQQPATNRISPGKGVPSAQRDVRVHQYRPGRTAAPAGGSSPKAGSQKAATPARDLTPQVAHELKERGLRLWSIANPASVAQALRRHLSGAGAWVRANKKAPPFIAGLALAIAYALASVVFSFRFLPGTTVNGRDASWKTVGAVARAAQVVAGEYALDVEGDGVSLSVSRSELRLDFDEKDFSVEASHRLPGWAWPLRLLGARDYEVGAGTSFDRSRLRSKVADVVARVNEGATPPQDAGIVYVADTGTFEAVDEQAGTQVDPDAALARVVAGVSQLRERVELGPAELVQPAVTARGPELAQALEEAAKRAQLIIPLTIQGETVRSVEGKLLCSFVALGEGCQVTGDLEAITTWARGDLSEQLDTVGADRTYVRPDDGKTIEVSGGTYGWCIDGASLAELIVGRIEADSAEPIEVPMISTGEVYERGGQDFGWRFIDVDLSEQYVRMYDGSQLVWGSECVSGDVGSDSATVTGVYTIYSKESPAKLIGLDKDNDGKPDYETDVDFWMPFYEGYGLHDAMWRWDFSWDVHQYDGSHGCVNLPYYAAEELFSLVEVDDVVVVHY